MIKYCHTELRGRIWKYRKLKNTVPKMRKISIEGSSFVFFVRDSSWSADLHASLTTSSLQHQGGTASRCDSKFLRPEVAVRSMCIPTE